MRDSTYVMIALALCSLVAVAMTMQKPRGMYMLDLEDFRHLPVELRSALRRMLPDPVTIRQRWAHMTPDQKQNAIRQLGGFIPQPQRPHASHRPHPNDLEPVETAPPVVEPLETIMEEPMAAPEPLKKGFLNTVEKGKKKDAKHKKKDEVVALRAVGADVSATSSPGENGFLGGDE